MIKVLFDAVHSYLNTCFVSEKTSFQNIDEDYIRYRGIKDFIEPLIVYLESLLPQQLS